MTDREKVRHILLERLRMGMVKHFTQRMIEDSLDLQAADDFFTGGIVCKLSAAIWAQKTVDRTYTVEWTSYPTWWDHFKAEGPLRRLFKKPAKMINHRKVIQFQEYHKYPDFHPPEAQKSIIHQIVQVLDES